MVKLLKSIDKILQFFYDYIMMIAGSAVVMLILAGAFMRYILKIDFYGSSEIILLFGYWLYFVGSISAARNRTHLSADMVNVFSKNPNIIRVMSLIRDVAALAICLLAIKWSTDYWLWNCKLNPVSSVLQIPRLWQQFPMYMAFVFWGVYLVRDVIVGVQSFKKGGTEA